MHKSVIIGVDVDVLRISGECYGSANIEPSHSRSLAELKNRIYVYTYEGGRLRIVCNLVRIGIGLRSVDAFIGGVL